MDSAKLRIFAAVGGALVGFAGVITLAAALALGLREWMDDVTATLVAGVALLAFAAAFFLLALRPQKSTASEVDDMEDVASHALAELPFDTLRTVVEQRPLAALGVAAMLGYTVMSDTEGALRDARKIVTGML